MSGDTISFDCNGAPIIDDGTRIIAQGFAALTYTCIEKINLANTSAVEKHDKIPTEFALSQNYPNPFNGETRIEYDLPKSSHVEIIIFNQQGQKVKTLVNDQMAAGCYQISWNGEDESGKSVASAVYFYQLKAGDFVAIRTMLLLH